MKTSTSLTPAATSRRQRLYLALGSVVFAVGFIVWPGCGSIPLRPTRTSSGTMQMKDLKNSAQAGLSKGEVFARLGKPDVWYNDLRVACYEINKLDKNNLMVFFFVPIGNDREKDAGTEVAMIQFDAQGVQLRQTRRQIYAWDTDVMMRLEAEHWVFNKTGPVR